MKRAKNIFIYLALTVGLFILAMKMLGFVATAAIIITVLVHECGHWAVWKLADEKALIFVSPFIGGCIPISGAGFEVFSCIGQGVLFLSGCAVSLLFSIVVHLFVLLFEDLAWNRFLFLLSIYPLALNLLNLFVLAPITDGGHWLMLVAGGSSRTSTQITGCFGLVQGLATFWLLDPVWCIIITVISLRTFPTLAAQSYANARDINLKTRLYLLGAWAVILFGSVWLLLCHPSACTSLCERMYSILTRFAEILQD